MTTTTLVRTATVTGALCFIAEGVLEVLEPQGQPLVTLRDHLIEAGFAAGLLLTLAGYFGLQLRQERAAGRLGMWGVRAAMAGQGTLGIIAFASLLRGGDVLGPLFMLGLLAWVGGTAAFAVATARAGVLPRWSGAALLVALLASFVVGPGGTVLLGVTWLGLAGVLLGDRFDLQPQAA